MTAMDDECFSNCVCKPHKKDKRFNDKKKNVVSIAKKDHVLKYCRKRIRSQNSTIHKSQGQNKNHGTFITETVQGLIQKTWILDSGASKHMSSRREWFHEFQEVNGDSVAIGDGTICQETWNNLHQAKN